MLKLITGSGVRCVFAFIWLMALVACDTNRSSLPVSSPTVVKAEEPSLQAEMAATAIPTPVQTPTGTATATPSQGPAPTNKPKSPLTYTRLITLASNLAEPDDLAVAPDGSLYISDVSAGTIQQYTYSDQLTVIVAGLSEPEGMVILADGTLVIAEQGWNRLVHFDPRTKKLSPLLNLRSRAGVLGVDGIELDTISGAEQSVIIPDSANGTVLRASLDGKQVTVIARGFARPTSAWAEADGSILVTDENANALKRIRPNGVVEKLASLPVPDDVIEDVAGNIYVATIGDNAIHMIAAATQRDTVLVSGLSSPQGIVFDADGNLVVADPGHHRLLKVVLN